MTTYLRPMSTDERVLLDSVKSAWRSVRILERRTADVWEQSGPPSPAQDRLLTSLQTAVERAQALDAQWAKTYGLACTCRDGYPSMCAAHSYMGDLSN